MRIVKFLKYVYLRLRGPKYNAGTLLVYGDWDKCPKILDTGFLVESDDDAFFAYLIKDEEGRVGEIRESYVENYDEWKPGPV